jgi:hypothetical protein
MERQLIASDYGASVTAWLEWTLAEHGPRAHDRFIRRLASRAWRRGPQGRDPVYKWRQLFDELQVAYLINSESRLRVLSADEPPGAGSSVLDWAASTEDSQIVHLEVKSLFVDPYAQVDARHIGVVDPGLVVRRPIEKAVPKFRRDCTNLAVLVVHEPRPTARHLFHELLGHEVSDVAAGLAGDSYLPTRCLDWRAGSSGRQSRGRMFHSRKNTRLSAVLFIHSRPDGTADPVLVTNPYAGLAPRVFDDLFDAWCRIHPSPGEHSLQVRVKGPRTTDLNIQPQYRLLL